MEPSELGLYGIFVATVGYGIYISGFEFYTFSMRELVTGDAESRVNVLLNHFAFLIAAYVLWLPVIIIFFAQGGLPWKLFSWFIVITPLEHLAQEFNRVLIGLSEQLLAGIILFIRSGFWCLFVFPVLWSFPEFRNLSFIFSLWIAGCLLACLIALDKVLKLHKHSFRPKLNIQWIYSGLKVAFPMLIASLASRGLFTFDKYLLRDVAGYQTLGAYILFMSIASAILSILDSGVVDFAYPKLLLAAQSGRLESFKQELHDYKRKIIVSATTLCMCCAVITPLMLGYIRNNTYTGNLNLFYGLIFAIFFNALSLIPHLGLYALKQDRPLVQSQVAGFIIFVVVSIALSRYYHELAIVWAMCAAWITVFVWKTMALQKSIRSFISIKLSRNE
jgi:hypothetical protein